MKEIKGNILDTTYGIIGHQVSCRLNMHFGLAREIKKLWPHVESEMHEIMSGGSDSRRLGRCQMVEIRRTQLYVANLFAQVNNTPLHKLHTDYTALGMALRNLRRWRDRMAGPDFPIYLPFELGTKEGGSDWRVVYGIIRDAIPDAVIVR